MIVRDIARWDKDAREYACETILDNANEWRDEEDPEIIAESFISRIRLSGISISVSGDYSMFYDDDDIFAGHVIVCEGDMKNGFTDSLIEG